MSLKLQIISLIVSFLYGIFFSFTLKINYKIVYNNNKILKIIGTFLYIIANALLYFYLLLKINNGIVHIYLLLSLLIGFILENIKIFKKV